MRSLSFLLLAVAACVSSPPPVEAPFDRVKLLDALERSQADEAARFAARFDAMTCDAVDDALREVTELPNPAVHVAFAKRVARCSSPSAAMIVFRIMPSLLLRRYDAAELSAIYTFLRADRPRALALFKTLLTDESNLFDLDPKDEPRPLRDGFRPERALDATCTDFDDVTPKYPAQFQSTLDVFHRERCDAGARALVRRSLHGASRVREVACSEAERSMPDLAFEIAEAARTDPGEPVYERGSSQSRSPSSGIVGALVEIVLSPLHPSTPRRVSRVDYPGRTICEPAAANLRAATSTSRPSR